MKKSEVIAGFLEFLRGVPLQYRIALSEKLKQEDLTQDLLHHLEIDNPSYRDTALTGQELSEARKTRRVAKDMAEVLAPIDQYIKQHKGEINALEKLLGDVRKVEQQHENRFYVPRVRKERDAE